MKPPIGWQPMNKAPRVCNSSMIGFAIKSDYCIVCTIEWDEVSKRFRAKFFNDTKILAWIPHEEYRLHKDFYEDRVNNKPSFI